MPETFFQHLHTVWQRLLDRLPSSEQGLEPELPVEAFGIAAPSPEPVSLHVSRPVNGPATLRDLEPGRPHPGFRAKSGESAASP